MKAAASTTPVGSRATAAKRAPTDLGILCLAVSLLVAGVVLAFKHYSFEILIGWIDRLREFEWGRTLVAQYWPNYHRTLGQLIDSGFGFLEVIGTALMVVAAVIVLWRSQRIPDETADTL